MIVRIPVGCAKQFSTPPPQANAALAGPTNQSAATPRPRRGGGRPMSSRSKEKMAAAFRKIFRSSQKIGNPEGAVAGGQGCSSGNGGSPARRLLRSHGYHRDAVTPAEVGDAPVVAVVAAAPASRKSVADLFKSKKGGGCCSGGGSSSSTTDKQTGGGGGVTGPHKTVRSRRLMKELREIERVQGRIAKKHKGSKDFNRRSAEESFRSLVKTHEKYGWVTPPMADG
uniref:Uncharacterized protein n=1 Tax=Timema cristinae TaxID=61476 RepID=A0A7R9CZE8_TIMCR|nr:unnamed protein product [Timema cristinae]